MRDVHPACLFVAVCLLSARGVRAAEPAVTLPARPQWTTSRVVGFPDPPPPYSVEPVYRALALKKPLSVGRFPDDDLMWVVTHEQDSAGPGRVSLFRDDEETDVLELLVERPEMIFGVAFHPDFASNRRLFIGCNGLSEALGEKATRVLRLEVSRERPYRCNAEAADVIIEWASDGHNGGDLAFGPDGMLYVSAGDGTSDSDPDLAGQDLRTLTGCILRIDVDHPEGERLYGIPADNPFVSQPEARPEIWAYGLRNPWRLTYDHRSQQLWTGNNGQDLWESAHLVRRGENYGWSVMEGSHPFQLERPRGPTPLVPPTLEHPHSESRSLTGGVVYHAGETNVDPLAALDGAYVYGDYSTGNIWAARHDGHTVVWQQHLARTSLQIAGFGSSWRGELLVVDHGSGLYRVVPQPPVEEAVPFPRLLSETGLFTNVARHELDPGVIPYSVNASLWSDGAAKLRFIGLPGDQQISFRESGTWDFPNDTVLVKSFSLPVAGTDRPGARRGEARFIETRLLVRQQGEWFGYSYAWNDEQTDAELVSAEGWDREFLVDRPETATDEAQTWRFPSRSECMVCHSRAAKFVLGLSTPQMNRQHDYGDGNTVNQLVALAQWGVFTGSQATGATDDAPHSFSLPKEPDELPRLVDPFDEAQPLEQRVRAYLDANCASCHVTSGGGNSKMRLDAVASLEELGIVDTVPQHTRFGDPEARLIRSGDPERSVLLSRLNRRGRDQMPPLGTNRVDDDAVALLKAWILSLPAQ